MIRRGGLALALLSLLGCSEREAATSENQAIAAGASSEAVSQAPAGTAESSSNPESASNLRSDVSSLSASVSDLDTRVTELGVVVDLAADALFEYDQASLTPAAAAELGKVAELIRRSPPGPTQVVGHMDSKGSDAYNQRLSEGRAGTVADWLRQQVGVRQREIKVSGKGETEPLEPNETSAGSDNPAGRAKNRRVEVIVPKI